jgi:hypothetical protein
MESWHFHFERRDVGVVGGATAGVSLTDNFPVRGAGIA